MRAVQSLRKLGVVLGAMMGSLLVASVVSAEGLTLGGYFQGSYQKNLNRPKTAAGAPTGNQLRSFDSTQDDDFNINQIQLNALKPVGDDGYGYGLKLMFGRDATSLSGTAGTDVFVEEAYAMYAPSKLKKLTITGGKFVTSEGVEVIESPLNLNITEGLLFGLAEPFTHIGAKAAYAFSDRISAMGGVVNGWDVDNDNNRGKTLIWQVATVPVSKMTANLSGTYGPEAANQTHQKRTSLDLVLGYSGIDKLTLNGQLNWGQDKQDQAATSVWKGAGIWVAYAASEIINPSVRFEIFDDQHGGSRSGTVQTVKDLTIGNKIVLNKNMFVRAEYRHDFSNVAAFQNKLGNTVRVQNTVGADWVVMF